MTPLARIALVEDEPDIRQSIEEYLRLAGFPVWGAGSAEAFYRQFAASPVDVVVLDLGLPGEDGLAVARLLETNPAVAVIIVSARDSLDDRLLGLRAGADRYLVKPVDLEELTANIRAVMKRLGSHPSASAQLSSPGEICASSPLWELDINNWQLIAPNRQALKMTAHELALLRRLFAVHGETVQKKQLANEVFGPLITNASNRLNVLVTRLRKKAADHFDEQLPLTTVHQIGYAFTERANLTKG